MPVRRSAQSSALACLFVGETFMPTGTYSRAAYSTAVQPSVFRADGRPKGRYPRRVCTKIGVFVVQPSTGTRTEDTIETQTQPPKDIAPRNSSPKSTVPVRTGGRHRHETGTPKPSVRQAVFT
jgi:hypothetical protein